MLPIHYDTFDIIAQDPVSWKDRVEGDTGAKVTVLKPGEKLTV